MTRYVIHNHFAHDKAGNSLGEQARTMHKRYLAARSLRILFENVAHRGGEDAAQVLKNREQANKYRAEEINLLEQYNAIVQSAILEGDQ